MGLPFEDEDEADLAWAKGHEDPLLQSRGGPFGQAFLWMANRLGRPISPESLQRALPTGGGALLEKDLPEVAQELGFVARFVPHLDPEQLHVWTLPAMVGRQDGGLWVVLHREDEGFWVLDPAFPDSGGRIVDEDHFRRCLFSPSAWLLEAKEWFDGRQELARGPLAGHWFWSAVRENASLYLLAVLTTVFVQVAGALTVFYVMAVYDRVIPNRALDTLWVLTVGVVVLYLMELGFKVVRAHVVDAAGRRFDLAVGSRVFETMLKLSPADRPATGGALAGILKEFETLRDFFSAATLLALGDLPFTLLFLFVLFWTASQVVWAPIFGIPLLLLVTALAYLPAKHVARLGQKDSWARASWLQEVSQNLDALQMLGGESWAKRRWEKLLVASAETAAKGRSIAQSAGNVTASLQSLIGVAVVVVAALLVADGKLSTGAMVAASILAGRAMMPLTQVAALLQRYQSVRAAYEALDQLMAKGQALEANEGLNLHQVKGNVELREVGFSYPAPEGSSPQAVLKGLNLKIAQGEHVGLLGRMGSGKSTLLSLLVGLRFPQDGQVLLEGLELRQIDLATLRKRIGYAAQFPSLFSGSVRDNLCVGKPGASDDEVLEACRISGLDQWLATCPEGLSFQVGEQGARLSGGTRQALGLARALLGRPPILLLDEPTSMMDTAAEAKLVERLMEARKGLTTIVVTHRPALMAMTRRLVVLDQGKVLLDGPRTKVLEALGKGGGPASPYAGPILPEAPEISPPPPPAAPAPTVPKALEVPSLHPALVPPTVGVAPPPPANTAPPATPQGPLPPTIVAHHLRPAAWGLGLPAQAPSPPPTGAPPDPFLGLNDPLPPLEPPAPPKPPQA